MTTAATGASGSNGFLVGIGSDGNAELWNYEAQPIIFATSSSERMRIDSSGNVGIGQTDPSGYWSQADNLVVGGSGNDGITIKSTSVGNGRLVFTDTKSTTAGLNDGGMLHYNHTDDVMIVHTAGSEAMRIDSSGSLLVSTTLNDGQSIGAGSQDGIVLAGVSQYIQRGGNANLWLSKPSGATNNTYINFYTNSSKVGSIGTFGGTTYYASNSHGFLINGTQIEPSNNTGGRLDNTVDIGSATYRFKNLYLSGGAYIGGTAAANKLDDYEEGTWTGTLGASTATTVTWGVGNYTKIGNMVYASFTVTVSEQTVGDNYIILYGPFAQHTASTHWIGFCNNYNSGNRESGIIINNSSGNTNEWFVGWQSNSTASKNVRGLIIYQTS
jgi:hypothetical protein